ncbi:MAG: type II toxin-antitoxin system RelE/ParE family toxin [Methylophilaceae bacterium]
MRFKRVESGNFGDHKPVGDGVSEFRVSVGAGYRVYYGLHGKTLVVLLCGGNKATQQADIKLAKEYWADWKRKNS